MTSNWSSAKSGCKIQNGFSQQTVADNLEISQNNYCKIESGKTTLTVASLFGIIEILNVDGASLFVQFNNKPDNDKSYAIVDCDTFLNIG